MPGGPKPSGPRSAIYSSKISQIQPLIEVMRAIGKERGGKTPAQVALNWTICKGALPIPGAKSAKQVGGRGREATPAERPAGRQGGATAGGPINEGLSWARAHLAATIRAAAPRRL